MLLSKKIKVNRQIRAPEVRVIDDAGKQIGVIKTTEAFQLAEKKDLDLVEVSSGANPPVVRLMDYGQHKYRLMKQQRKSKAKTKKVETKGVRIGLRTGDHDLQFKAKQATKFLKQGHRVKIEFVLKGREKVHRDLAEEKLDDFIKNMIQTNTETVQKAKFMGMGLVSIVTEGSEEPGEE
ncbi:translation initiation factor IF-3 [Patescibacteria group bacterium]